MKSNTLFAILVLSILSLISSCGDEDASNPSTCLITQIGSGANKAELFYNAGTSTQLDSIIYYESGNITRVKRLAYENGKLSSLVDDDKVEGITEEKFLYANDGQLSIVEFYDGSVMTNYDSVLFSNNQIVRQIGLSSTGSINEEYQYTYTGNNISKIEVFAPGAANPYRTLSLQYDTELKNLSEDFATLFAIYHAGDFLVPELFSENSRTIRVDVDGTSTESDTISYTANNQNYPATINTGFGTSQVFYENCQ